MSASRPHQAVEEGGGGASRDSVHVESRVSNSPAIGKVSQLAMSFFAGDGRQLAEDAKAWNIWNWPPFLLVVGLSATAKLIQPRGPAAQFWWVWVAIAVAFALSLVRLVGVPGALASRVRRSLMSALSLALAVTALVGMDQLKQHGEVNVTGQTRLTPSSTVHNGSHFHVTVQHPPDRSYLRLKLNIEDAPARTDIQSCTPSTRYSAQVARTSDTRRKRALRSGRSVELRLRGPHDDVRVDITLTTDSGCLMKATVAEAALHD